jgi:hypothetical protein
MIRAVLLLTLVATAVLVLEPVDRRLVADVYFLLLGALLLLAGLRLAGLGRRRQPSAFDRALASPARRPLRPSDLVRLEDQVTVAVAAAGDLHFRLRPLLREIAEQRLETGHGVDPVRQPQRARALVGEDAWDVVRPDAVPPPDRFERGIAPERLDRVVSALEQL